MMDKGFVQDFFNVVGVTLAAAIASVFGAVAGLAFAKNVTPRQEIIIVLAGVGTGSFGSAGIVSYWQLSTPTAGAIAFGLGVVAMPLLGLAFGLVSRWRDKAPELADRGADKVLGKDENNPRHPEAP